LIEVDLIGTYKEVHVKFSFYTALSIK
jgi:hypothetical protein